MKKLTFLLLIFISCFTVFAQNDEKEITEEITDLINYHIIGSEDVLNVNMSLLNQTGNENSIVAIQQNSGAMSNLILSNQFNDGNKGYIEQTGDGHQTVLQQSGFNNEANIWSVGSLTGTWVIQQGDDNMINSYIDNEGILPKAALLQQNGNNNQIDFALLGNGLLWNAWPKGAYVKQTGDDLGVTAIFDSYQYPVYIEQQSGVNGGMNVNVSTTTFSFPMKRY